MYQCAQSAITFNNLNLPCYDIHSNQSRDQILVNLQMLDQSYRKIGENIMNKNKQQNQRIQNLRIRILKCKQRIEQIQGVKKAITFVSPAQYPIPYTFDPQKNKSIFHEYLNRNKMSKMDMEAHYQLKHEMKRLGTQSTLKINDLNNFVTFLYGELRTKKKHIFQRGIPHKKHYATFGKVPKNVHYIDSLLVFNSNVNPYRKFEVINNNLIIQKRQDTKKQEETSILPLDPTTFNKYDITKFNQISHGYIPKEKPMIEIPFEEDLDLGGIVDFITEQYQQAPINPSKPGILKKNVPQDPYLNKKNQQNTSNATQNNKRAEQQKRIQSSITSASSSKSNLMSSSQTGNIGFNSSQYMTPNAQPSSSNSNATSNLLPPPPPPISFSQNNLQNLPPPPPPPPLSTSSGLSLPPPPPPPQLSNTLGGNLQPPGPPPSLGQSSAQPSKGSGRAALLKQIQNPNPMARLRKTVTKQTPVLISFNQQKQPDNSGAPDPNKPMNHMEALQAKIRNRFKALHPQRNQQDDY